MNKTILLTTVSMISLLASPLAIAGAPEAAPMEIEQPQPRGNWEFELGLYGFIAGIDGTVSAGTQSADISFDIEDILDHLDMTFMAEASAKKDRFRISGDLLYLGLSGDGSPIGPRFNYAKIEMDTLLSTVAATYAVWEQPGCFLEIGGGFRYMGMDTDLGFFDTTGRNRNLFESGDVDLWDALAVVRFGYQFSPKWAFRFYGDIGAGDSDLTWQVFGTLAYAVTENTYATLGYRYLDYELGSGPVDADISISGPQLGLIFRF